jgi:hypothetical protein
MGATLVVSVATLRAASRVTPRMAAYRVKRVARDFLARQCPVAYANYIARVASSVPLLDSLTSIGDGSSSDLARSVAVFYYDEYVDMIDDAAKGRFTLLNRTVDFGNVESIDWHHQLDVETDFHLWRQKLAHMGFVCPMLTAANDDYLKATQGLIASYRETSDFGVRGCFSSYWFPYSVSHRILAILSGYVVAMQGRGLPEGLRHDIESFLRWNVGFLLANVEHELRNNHVERNLAALCMYFSYVSSPPTKIGIRLDREVRKIMDACILSDGFSAERSAMYQGLAVMSLEVFSKAGCLSPETREIAESLHAKAVRAWHLMTHPDGDIALFNDSWIGEVPQAGHVAGHHDFAPLELLPNAGYARLQSGAAFALMDAGPIGPRWCPGHGHADFLAVEIDIASRRFVVDPGTYQYSTGPRRAFERSASSHNGPIRAGVEPVEYTGCFRVGNMSEAKFVESNASEEGGSVWGRLELSDGSAVDRRLEARPDTLRIVDGWFGDATDAFVRLTVSDDWVLAHLGDHSVVFKEGDTTVELSVIEGRIVVVESGEWSSRYLESRPATTVILNPVGDQRTGRLVWEVRAIS